MADLVTLGSGDRSRARRAKARTEKRLGQFADGLRISGVAAESLVVSKMVKAFDETAVATRRVTDRLFAHWIERADRFGAVAAHFPRSLRCRMFMAGFWALEVMLFGDWYLGGAIRDDIDWKCARQVSEALGWTFTRTWLAPGASAGVEGADCRFPVWQVVDLDRRPFWSPELPEVLP